jgi:hypothetical protein
MPGLREAEAVTADPHVTGTAMPGLREAEAITVDPSAADAAMADLSVAEAATPDRSGADAVTPAPNLSTTVATTALHSSTSIETLR